MIASLFEKSWYFCQPFWKFTQSARQYTITIIRLLRGLYPLLPVAETVEKTTQTKHVKEIVDAEARLGALGLSWFLWCFFFCLKLEQKRRYAIYARVL